LWRRDDEKNAIGNSLKEAERYSLERYRYRKEEGLKDRGRGG
jgi:hypothetical protein